MIGKQRYFMVAMMDLSSRRRWLFESEDSRLLAAPVNAGREQLDNFVACSQLGSLMQMEKNERK
jgi:hypothetical protein